MTENLIYEMIRINGKDMHRINHALKVYALAECIAGREHVSDNVRQTVAAAAILHDIAIRHCEKTYGACGGKLQEQEGPAIARPILEKYTDDEAFISRVLHIIAHHHSPDTIDGIDLQIVSEADFLVNREEGDISEGTFHTVRQRYFKTAAGKELAEYIVQDQR